MQQLTICMGWYCTYRYASLVVVLQISVELFLMVHMITMTMTKKHLLCISHVLGASFIKRWFEQWFYSAICMNVVQQQHTNINCFVNLLFGPLNNTSICSTIVVISSSKKFYFLFWSRLNPNLALCNEKITRQESSI